MSNYGLRLSGCYLWTSINKDLCNDDEIYEGGTRGDCILGQGKAKCIPNKNARCGDNLCSDWSKKNKDCKSGYYCGAKNFAKGTKGECIPINKCSMSNFAQGTKKRLNNRRFRNLNDNECNKYINDGGEWFKDGDYCVKLSSPENDFK